MSDKERNQQVAMTILQQLGGQGKLAAMHQSWRSGSDCKSDGFNLSGFEFHLPDL